MCERNRFINSSNGFRNWEKNHHHFSVSVENINQPDMFFILGKTIFSVRAFVAAY